jgi:hypothetical protein
MLDKQNQGPQCTAPVMLIIEDDQSLQGVVEDALTEGGFEPAIALSGDEAARS